MADSNILKTKARYWEVIAYPENMKPDWEDTIGDDFQSLPYAYCIHDKDTLAKYKPKQNESHMRKTHVHILIIFNNTTTGKTALDLANSLSADGKICCSTVKDIKHIRGAYDYLLHDTQTAKKQGKYQYYTTERKTGNNFDIGLYEQISSAQRDGMRNELAKYIIDEDFTNFTNFYSAVVSNFDVTYLDIASSYSSFFERLTKGNYQRSNFIKIEDHERIVKSEVEKALLQYRKANKTQ